MDEGCERCALCGRSGVEMNRHHLVPRSRGGRETAAICLTCHRQVHALFDNRTLERELGSIESLRQHPALQPYLRWVRKRRGWFRVRKGRPI